MTETGALLRHFLAAIAYRTQKPSGTASRSSRRSGRRRCPNSPSARRAHERRHRLRTNVLHRGAYGPEILPAFSVEVERFLDPGRTRRSDRGRTAVAGHQPHPASARSPVRCHDPRRPVGFAPKALGRSHSTGELCLCPGQLGQPRPKPTAARTTRCRVAGSAQSTGIVRLPDPSSRRTRQLTAPVNRKPLGESGR